MLIFQFTLPREERRQVQAQPLTLQNFNPRSHERSDFTGDYTFEVTLISIHAPTRGATCVAKRTPNMRIISIHAPTRGATAILHKKFVYFYTIPTINI